MIVVEADCRMIPTQVVRQIIFADRSCRWKCGRQLRTFLGRRSGRHEILQRGAEGFYRESQSNTPQLGNQVPYRSIAPCHTFGYLFFPLHLCLIRIYSFDLDFQKKFSLLLNFFIFFFFFFFSFFLYLTFSLSFSFLPPTTTKPICLSDFTCHVSTFALPRQSGYTCTTRNSKKKK